MTHRAWICEGCGRGQVFRDNVWDCPGCGKEGCDSCFWMFGHCKPCSVGKTQEELRVAANAKWGDTFEPFDNPEEGQRIALEHPSVPHSHIGSQGAQTQEQE